jgi:hypothetical protein
MVGEFYVIGAVENKHFQKEGSLDGHIKTA